MNNAEGVDVMRGIDEEQNGVQWRERWQSVSFGFLMELEPKRQSPLRGALTGSRVETVGWKKLWSSAGSPSLSCRGGGLASAVGIGVLNPSTAGAWPTWES